VVSKITDILSDTH